nr:hypothetical protein [Micromonospora sp. DSM 115978]
MTTDEQRRFATLTDRCHRLVRFLHELAASATATVDDVADNPLVMWLTDLPAGLSLFDQARAGEVLLSAPASSALPPRPVPPVELARHLDLPAPGELPADGDPPLR